MSSKMKARLFCFVILGAIIFGVCNGAPQNSPEEDAARNFAEDASKKLFDFYDELIIDTLKLEPDDNNLLTFLNSLDSVLNRSALMLEVVQNASRFTETIFNDKELNLILKKLKISTDESILGPDRFFEILSAMRSLEKLAAEKDIEGYKNENITLSYFPEIEKIFATSNNPEEMKYYWSAWRERNAVWAMVNFLFLVNGTRDAASVLGLSPYEYWMKDFNMAQMDAVMTQIEPIYRQIHGFLRHKLNKKYGDAIIDAKGLIPDHLFQQVLAQVWTSGSVIEDNFPYKDLPAYDQTLAKNKLDTLKLFKMAEQFYESMGFEAVNDNYWGTRLKTRTDEDEGDCKPTILVKTPNVFMQYCHKMDFRTFLQAHGYMTEIHFALEKPDLPFYYFGSYNLEYAVGEAVILSASSPKHLAKVGIITEPELSDEVVMNRLMRLSIHTMLNIPVHYVHTKVIADLFLGTVELTELNKHYWGLMDKYVGVGPPGDRVNNTFDFPYKFYLELNENKQARKFNSEILSYQFYKKLCSIAGQYPHGELQNCDFSDSKEAGDVLKKMIKVGSSKPINEVLATILPEDPKLNALGLVEYYFPAFSWFEVANQQNKVNIGFIHSDKKIGSVTLPILNDDL